MIVSASYKTDIPAFYAPWFSHRLKAGFCKMVNPYNQKITHISLQPYDVQGFVFWSRNYQPFMDRNILEDIKRPFTCQMSVMNYPRQLDKATIAASKAIEQIHHLAARFGPRCVVWRYDPIVLSPLTPIKWHVENFAMLAAAIAPSVDEVIVSFMQLYRKTAKNFKTAGIEEIDVSVQTQQNLLLQLHEIASTHGIKLTLCAQPELLITPIEASACIDVKRLEDFGGTALIVDRKPHRRECGCASSKDIGAYDSCPHGCLYCYAVENHSLAKNRFQRHDPHSPFLFEEAVTTEETTDQLSFF
ncbi:MAG: DUF1848 domain-containing protein [Methylocystaceae bacterium]|nr:DUF1848 domain-containing protein [Methylocystaceae bacterium]